MSVYQIASVVAVVSNTLVPLGFMIYYQVRTRGGWRRSVTGWHIMSLTGNDVLIFAMLLLQAIFLTLATSVVYQWAYLLVVWGVTPITTWRWLMVRREQRRGEAAVSVPDVPLDPVP